MKIEGILVTMFDSRTDFTKGISEILENAYGSKVRIFKGVIPTSVRVAESNAEGKSIFLHNPNGKVAKAYEELTRRYLKMKNSSANRIDMIDVDALLGIGNDIKNISTYIRIADGWSNYPSRYVWGSCNGNWNYVVVIPN